MLWRPAQRFCDRCRPAATTRDLARQRERRARLKAAQSTRALETVAHGSEVATSEQSPAVTLVAVLAACLDIIEQRRAFAEREIERELSQRRVSGLPLGPAYRRLDPYNELHLYLGSARGLAEQLGM